jgi:hypothetical protein
MFPAKAFPSDYTGPGFHFRYPPGWVVDEDQQDQELTVTVRPEGEETTAFWSLTILPDRPNVQQVLRAVLRAYEEDYPELDTYPVEQEIAGRKASGRDLEFVCLELLNTARLRVFRTRDFTAVVLCQAMDEELEAMEDAFRLLTSSLQCGWEGPGGEQE